MQKGFSLAEALVAMLLLSVSLLGLLQYYQVINNGFLRQWQFRQAWFAAHKQLDTFSVEGVGSQSLVSGWKSQVSAKPVDSDCQFVTAKVETPSSYVATLHRWICRSAEFPASLLTE